MTDAACILLLLLGLNILLTIVYFLMEAAHTSKEKKKQTEANELKCKQPEIVCKNYEIVPIVSERIDEFGRAIDDEEILRKICAELSHEIIKQVADNVTITTTYDVPTNRRIYRARLDVVKYN